MALGRLAFHAAWEEAVGLARRLLRRGLRPLVRAAREPAAGLPWQEAGDG